MQISRGSKKPPYLAYYKREKKGYPDLERITRRGRKNFILETFLTWFLITEIKRGGCQQKCNLNEIL